MKSSTLIKKIFICLAVFACLSYGLVLKAQENIINSNVGTINAASENESNRVAPGEFLPVSIKLINFGRHSTS